MGVNPTSWMFLTMMCVTVLSGNISRSKQESDKPITSTAPIGFFTFQEEEVKCAVLWSHSVH